MATIAPKKLMSFPVIINVDYGGCTLSDSIMKAYNALPDVSPIKYPYDFDRTDERLAHLVENSTERSTLVVEKIPVEYRNYYRIDEYDGSETIVVKFAEYQVAMIKSILTGSSDDKLGEINAFIENSSEQQLEDAFKSLR